jgi:hypothetical protein
MRRREIPAAVFTVQIALSERSEECGQWFSDNIFLE